MGLTAITKGTNLTKKQKADNRALFLKEPGVNDKINSIATSMGVSSEEILHAIEKETAGSYSPSQKNLAGGSAVGLIQFVGTGTDKGKGGKTVNGTFYKSSELEDMTALEQLDVVEGYFIENFQKKGGKPGQIYNSIAAPSSVGKPGDKVIYAAGSAAAKQNPGWQNPDGSVTTDSMASFGGSPDFSTYTPQVAGVSITGLTPPEEPENESLEAVSEVSEAPDKDRQQSALDAVNKIKRAKEFKSLRSEISPALQAQIEAEIIEFSEEFAASMEKGWVGSRDEVPEKGKEFDRKLNEYVRGKYKELALDDSKPEDWAKMKAIFKYASSIPAGEDFGIKIGNKENRLIDTNFEVMMEDRGGKGNWSSMFGGASRQEDTIPEDIYDGLHSDSYISSVLSDKARYGLDFELHKGRDILDISDKKLAERAGIDISGKYFGDDNTQAKQLIQDVLAGEKQEKPSETPSVDHDSLAEGAADLEALNIESEEEDEDSMESLGLNEDGSTQVVEDVNETDAVSDLKDRRTRQMAMAEKALTGLKAAAGLTSLSKALQEPDIKTPQVSNLLKEALNKQKHLSTMGLNAAEKASAMSGINDAYASAIKNVVGGSGGQRGMFLANQGVVDANRIKGLVQLSAQDAAVRRQNVGQYNQLASSVGQMQLSADMSAEQMKQQAIAQNKQMLGGIGSNLLSDAISDASYYLNPNKEHMDEMMKQYMETQTSNNGYTPPTDDDVIGMNNPSMTHKERKAEAARVALEKKNSVLT
tara:strand:+ start:7124 stop:9397 length:2274 start_codon:yes stop_codon:yes gene_type:complete